MHDPVPQELGEEAGQGDSLIDSPVTVAIAAVAAPQREALIAALAQIGAAPRLVVQDEMRVADADLLLTGQRDLAWPNDPLDVWVRWPEAASQPPARAGDRRGAAPLQVEVPDVALAARLAPLVRLAQARRRNMVLAARLETTEARSRRLFEIAYRDHLTGLDNRHALFEKAAVLLAECPPDRKLGLFILDLDGFKTVNDRFGHHVGDQVLGAIAERLRRIPRRGDVIARLGGDEIVIVIGGADGRGDCAALARRMIEALSEPFRAEGQVLSVGASIGISIFPDDGADIRSLLRQADMALYKAKAVDSSVFCFPHDMPRRVVLAHEPAQEALLYRPILSADGRSFKGAQLMPGASLDLQLAEARQRLEAWHAAGGRWRLSVPLAAELVGRADLSKLVGAALDAAFGDAAARHAPDAGLLELVVPASAVVQADPSRLVAELRSRGVGVCLDALTPNLSGLRRLLAGGWTRVQVQAPAEADLESGYLAWLSLAADLLRERDTLLCLSGIGDAGVLRALMNVAPDEFCGPILGESLDAVQLERLRVAVSQG